MTAPAAPTATEPDPADVLRARIAKRIRWAQHARSRDAADQVAAEIVRDLVASFAVPTDAPARELTLRLTRIQNALVGELGNAATSSTRAALGRVLDVLDEETRRPHTATDERQAA